MGNWLERRYEVDLMNEVRQRLRGSSFCTASSWFKVPGSTAPRKAVHGPKVYLRVSREVPMAQESLR